MNKDKVAMEILHAKSRVGNRKEGKILCDTCKYNTNDFVRHPNCRWCDGRSKYVSDTEQ